MEYNINDIFINMKDSTYIIKIIDIKDDYYIVKDINPSNRFFSIKEKYMIYENISKHFNKV